MDKLAEQFARYVAAKVRAGADVDPALRLVGRRAVGRRLRGVRRAVLGAHPRCGRRADDPLRHRHDRRCSLDARARGRRRDRPRLAHPARPRLGAVGDERGVQGNLDPAVLLGPWERVEASRARRPRRARDGRPGHIFNLGHGVLPQTDPAVLARLDRARAGADRRGAVCVTRVVLMAYGSPERLADVPAYYADIRGGRPIAPGAARRPRRALPPARDRGLVAAQRDHRGDARGARARARPAGLHRDEALDAAHRRRRRRRARRRRRHASSASCSRRTTPRSRSRATASSSSRRSTAAPSSASSRAGTTSRASSTSSPTGCAARTRTSSSPRTRCRRGSSTMGDPYKDQLLETAELVAERGRRRRLVVLVPERVADRRAVARAGHPRPPRATSHARGVARRARLPGRLRLRPPRDPLGLDVEARGARGELGLELEPDRDAERRPGVRRRRSPAIVRRALGYRRPHETGRDRRRARRAALPRLSAREPRAQGSDRRARPRARLGRLGAARRVVRASSPGSAIGLVGRNGSGKTTLLRLLSRDHQADVGPRRRRRARRLAARARRRLPPRPDRARERLPQRLDPRAQRARRSARSSTRSSPSPGSRSSSTCRCARTRRGCTCGSASRSRRTSRPTCCCSTRSSPSATRRSSASASARSSSSSSAAGRSSSSRTTRPRSSGSATARCC